MNNKVWSVSELNSAVRELIERTLVPVWMTGEVGTLMIHGSGHVYITMKDQRTQMKVVFFGGANIARQMNLQVGMKIEVQGRLTVYEPRGEYQLSIREIRPIGLGNLQLRFEELKNKLAREGLFDEQRKKRLPLLPQKIGIVTSPSGAAIRDFLQIINRRFPNINIKIYPAAVQGKGSEFHIAEGVNFFNRLNDIDIIVVTRGGGSMEDLWSFNEEVLARAIANSAIPVVSAVGHEIDFTICDFVSDLRVPTPSAAAELVVGKQSEFLEFINQSQHRIKNSLFFLLERYKSRLNIASNSYVFREPARIVREKQQIIDELTRRMEYLLKQKTEYQKNRLNVVEGRLKALSPYAALNRGYSVLINKETNKTINSAQIAKGTKISALVANGQIDMVVEDSKITNA